MGCSPHGIDHYICNTRIDVYVGVERKIGGKPPKWMVKIMENPMNKWGDFGGTIIFGNTHINVEREGEMREGRDPLVQFM